MRRGTVAAETHIAEATAAPVSRAGTTPSALTAPPISKNLPVKSVAETAATTAPAVRARSTSQEVQRGCPDIRMMSAWRG